MTTKEDVLLALRSSEGFVSGQELCDRLQVSRTAVWKRIQQLKEDGYEIASVPNRGYRILGSPDTIAGQEVSTRLHTKWIGRPIHYFEQITSTNQYAKRLGEEGCGEGVLVIADEQTQGKGRVGRSWSTPPGTAVAMSLLLRPQIAPERISMVTLVMGMAVAQACRSCFKVDAGIKWPNDVVIGGRKLCGILTEMSAEMNAVHYIVIGVGINVNVSSFPEDIAQTATSLSLELGRQVNRAGLIAEVMRYFEAYYEEFLRAQDLSGLMNQYNAMLVNRDRPVRVLQPSDSFEGIAEGINEKGELLVRREDGTVETVYAGEVSVRGIYGYV